MPKDDVVDTTQQTVDATKDSSDTTTTEGDTENVSGSEQKLDADGKPVIDADKTDKVEKTEDGAGKVTNKQEELMQSLLLEYDLETPEQLGEFIKGLNKLKTKVGDADIDDLIDNKALMTKYKRYWAAQEASKKKEGETPEETIIRLEKEAADRDKVDEQAKSDDQDLKEAKKAVESFNATVYKTIKGIENIPEEYRDFLGLFMGADNPINEIDLKDRGKIIDLTKKGAKQLLDFEQVIIKRYMKGKTEVPVVTTTTDTNTEPGEKPIKSLSEARKRMANIVKAQLLKK